MPTPALPVGADSILLPSARCGIENNPRDGCRSTSSDTAMTRAIRKLRPRQEALALDAVLAIGLGLACAANALLLMFRL